MNETASCSLDADALHERKAQWHALLERFAVSHEGVPNGFSAAFRPEPEALREIERLAALESHCCSWMKIEVTVRVTASTPEGAPIVAALRR